MKGNDKRESKSDDLSSIVNKLPSIDYIKSQNLEQLEKTKEDLTKKTEEAKEAKEVWEKESKKATNWLVGAAVMGFALVITGILAAVSVPIIASVAPVLAPLLFVAGVGAFAVGRSKKVKAKTEIDKTVETEKLLVDLQGGVLFQQNIIKTNDLEKANYQLENRNFNQEQEEKRVESEPSSPFYVRSSNNKGKGVR